LKPKLKMLAILMMAIMLVIPGKAQAALPSAYPLGLSEQQTRELINHPIFDDTGEEYAVDYRHIQSPGRATKEEKPTAQFEVLANGQVAGQSNKENNLDAPTTVIDVNLNDKITLRDISQPYSGNKLSSWDLQYRILPVPEENITDINAYRSKFPIKALVDFRPELAGSKEGINTYFQEALKEMKDDYPEQDCYIELYLEVADKTKTNQEGWSDNGTYAYHKTKEMGSPYTKGHIWYFSTALLRVNTKGVPDFFPTPEGSDQWQESYKTCAKTYIGTPGETVNINFALHNAGEKQTTDFAATWFGSGWENPIWKVDDIALDKGSKQDFNLSVKVPAAGQETRLVFLANIDGKTPAAESNQENNIMIITISSDIDLAATGIRSGVSGVPVPGQRYTGTVSFTNITKGYLTNVPIGAYNNGYKAVLKDGSSNIVEVSDFGPSETKEFTFQWTLDALGYSKLEECINVDPLPVVYPEKNYNNNKNSMVVTAAIKPESGQELRSRAHQQISIREFQGNPIVEREPNTCKWSDIVRTYLYPLKGKNIQYYITNDSDIDYSKTIAPPRPGGDDECGSYSVLKSWEITEGYISYPKQSSSFSFNNPVWWGEYAQEKLIIDQGGHRGKANWQNWFALDGFPMKNIRTGQYNGPPKSYNLTCNYTIKVVYDKTVGHVVCNDDGCWCVYKEYKNQVAYYHYKAAGSILVNGAGTTPQPAGYVDDWLKRHPGAPDPRKTYVYPEG